MIVKAFPPAFVTVLMNSEEPAFSVLAAPPAKLVVTIPKFAMPVAVLIVVALPASVCVEMPTCAKLPFTIPELMVVALPLEVACVISAPAIPALVVVALPPSAKVEISFATNPLLVLMDVAFPPGTPSSVMVCVCMKSRMVPEFCVNAFPLAASVVMSSATPLTVLVIVVFSLPAADFRNDAKGVPIRFPVMVQTVSGEGPLHTNCARASVGAITPASAAAAQTSARNRNARA
ncbi:MAG TPA: hypothetical protein VGC86_14185 [Afipia sp.]